MEKYSRLSSAAVIIGALGANQSLTTKMCVSIGAPKNIYFPFVHIKLMVFRYSNILCTTGQSQVQQALKITALLSDLS